MGFWRSEEKQNMSKEKSFKIIILIIFTAVGFEKGKSMANLLGQFKSLLLNTPSYFQVLGMEVKYLFCMAYI